ncbi:MAG: DUF2911 domain-containing protein [Gemmatimonadetes bacterium]|nr:DUF2911 domain-containing protein [Gemmatimonadota bacterium]
MRRAALLLALLAACAPGASPVPQGESGAYVVTFGPDTVALERYTRTADRLTGEMVSRIPRTVATRYEARLNPDGSVSSLRTELRLLGTEDPPPPITFSDEFAAGTITETPATGQPRRIATPGTALPDLGYSIALREQWIRHALRRGGNASFFLFPVREDSVVAVQVRTRGDSVHITSIDGEVSARVDRRGRLLHWDGLRSTDKFVATRAATVDLEARSADFAARDRAGQGVGQLSPRDSVSMAVGGARVSVSYGRPSLRGRTAVGGVLVPWGQVWRTGANSPTRLRTDRELEIGGARVPAGTYALYTLPTPRGWTLILNRRTGGSGRDYVQADDFARVPVETAPLAETVERLTIRMEPSGESSGMIRVAWENTEVRIPFRVR